MLKQYVGIGSVVGLALLSASSVFGSPISINFSVFPGADNAIGTADDLPLVLVPGSSGGLQTRFTNEFAFLNGGVGFLVDSLCCAGSQGLGVGSIENDSGGNLLVQARPDVDSTAFSFGSLDFRMVSSADGTTPTTVRSVDIRFSPGSSGTVQFFNGRGDLRFGVAVPQTGARNILYSDADGLARVVFLGVGGVNLFEFDAASALTAPPENVTPEPGAFRMMLGGVFIVAGLVRLVSNR